MSCETCIHWKKEMLYDLGECRRYPPRVVAIKYIVDSETKTLWPQTKNDDDCGEYQPIGQ